MARPRAADHEDKRRAILQGAARLFAEQGYGQTAMSQVAAACGISKALIYHYYDGKEALLFDILDTHLSTLADRIRSLALSGPPKENLRTIVEDLLLAYEGHDAEHAVQLNALHALPDAQQEVLRTYQRDLVTIVRTQVAALAPPSVAADTGTLRALTMSVFALANWHYQWDGQADAGARRRYAAMVADLIAGGVPALKGDAP